MSRLVIVKGLEMFAFMRNPGGAECDVCGLRMSWPRVDFSKEISELESAGWKFSGHNIRDSSVCPECIETN